MVDEGIQDRIKQFLADKQETTKKLEKVDEWIAFLQKKPEGRPSEGLIKEAKQGISSALQELEMAFGIILRMGRTGVVKPKEGFPIKPRLKKERKKFILPEEVDLATLANQSSSLTEMLKSLCLEDNPKNRSNLSARISLLRKNGKEIKQFPRGRKMIDQNQEVLTEMPQIVQTIQIEKKEKESDQNCSSRSCGL